MTRVSYVTAMLVAVMLACSGATGSDVKIGIVDGKGVVEKSPLGMAIKEKITKKTTELVKPIVEAREALTKEFDFLMKQAARMKDDDLQRKAQAMEKRLQLVRQQDEEAKRQLAEYQDKELAPLLEKLDLAVKTVAEAEKLDVVMDRRSSGVMYLNPRVDITEKVRAAFTK